MAIKRRASFNPKSSLAKVGDGRSIGSYDKDQIVFAQGDPADAASFNPKSFLAKVGDGRSIGSYDKDQIVFAQGDPADAVFYIQKGKVKLTVVSEQGKEGVVAILGTNDSFGEGCLAGQPQWG
jgi:CRP-like cAMP-binding protein